METLDAPARSTTTSDSNTARATLKSLRRSVNAILPGWPRRRRALTDRRVWGLLTLLYLALWTSLFQVYDGGQFIDPFNHIIYLTSLFHDRDLDFANDIVAANTFDRQRLLQLGRLAPNGMVMNNWPPGAALIWAPAYALTWAAGRVIAAALDASPPERFAFAPMAAISLTTAACGLLALFLLYRLARLRSRPGPAGAAAAAALACSPLPFHLLRCPASDHGLAALAIAWWLWLAMSRWGAHPCRRGLWLGLAGGLMALVRWQDVVFGLAGLAALAPRVAREVRRRPLDAACALGLALLGFASVVAVQLVLWRITAGAWIVNPHGPGYIHWDQPAFVALLFSGKGGMLYWHPAMTLGFLGLALIAARRPVLGAGLWAAVLIHLHVCAAVDDWHGEWGIGNRRLTELLPILTLGFAAVFSRTRSRAGALVLAAGLTALALANWLFLLFGHRGPIGIFSPLNHAGWATLARHWTTLWEAIAANPAVALIDNTFFTPWLDLRREPSLAQAGLCAALLPIAVLCAGRRLAAAHALRRHTGPALVAALVALQGFLLCGLRAPAGGVAETGAIAARLRRATPSEAREVRRLTERMMPEWVNSPPVFVRLLGLNHRARLLAHESWDPELLRRHLHQWLQSSDPPDKFALHALLDVQEIEFAPGQRMGLALGDRGLLGLCWPHWWDQRLMQPLFRRLVEPERDGQAIARFFDLTDRAPVLWWSCQWFDAMNPPGDAPPDFRRAVAALDRLRIHNPLDPQTLDLLVQTLRRWGRTDRQALRRAEAAEALIRDIAAFEIDRLVAARDSRLYVRGFLEDRLNFYLALPHH